MSLVGNLKDLGLAEILQIVSLSRKSGVLGILSGNQEAKILFRQGQVVKASATSHPVDLSQLLLSKGLLDSASLDSARLLQSDGGFRQALGDILVSRFKVEAALLEDTLRVEIEQTIYSLFSWEEGSFDFELQDDLDVVDDLRTDKLQYMLVKGLSPQFLAMEGSRLIDEQRHAASKESAPDRSSEDHTAEFEFDLLKDSAGSGTPQMNETIRKTVTIASNPVILIDDDEYTREAVSAELRRHSYGVTSFANGEEALLTLDTLHRESVVPIVLVDLVMPMMDGTGQLGGLELLGLIHENFPEFNVLVTADRRDVEAEKALADMGYPVIIKPSPVEIVKESLFSWYCSQLLRNIGDPGNRLFPFTDRVNIGDELRKEMGEGTADMEPQTGSSGISHLRGMLEELNNPSMGGGILLLVLRFASEFMARGVIFTIRENEIAGLGQFGIDDRDQSGDMMVRAMRFPLEEETVFSQVVESKLPVKLLMDDSRWCRYLQKHLGGNASEAFLGPIVSEESVVAVLYGDNGDDSRPIGDTDSLEIFLSQAGIAMEKALLLRKLKEHHLEGM